MRKARWTVRLTMAMLACTWLAGCAPQRKASVPAVPTAPPSTKASSPSGTPASPGGTPASPGTSAATEPPATPAGSESTPGRSAAKTPDEHRDTLDRDLDGSLAKFDAMLLKEQQEIAAKRAEQAASGTGGEGEEGQGAGGGAGGGGAAGTSGSPSAGRPGQAGSQKSAENRGEQKGSGSTKDQATGSSRGGSREGGGGREVTTAPEGTPPNGDDASRLPADVGDGHDDDVVARQIREAAMSEADPVIRDKLWEEYRRYKRGER